VLVRVSCIQNTQIRGETTAKVFGKVDTFWTYQWLAGLLVHLPLWLLTLQQEAGVPPPSCLIAYLPLLPRDLLHELIFGHQMMQLLSSLHYAFFFKPEYAYTPRLRQYKLLINKYIGFN
jgi:hypothetical protein